MIESYYKYWLYYTNNGRLTAYTSEKELAKLFESQRNFKYYNKDKKDISRSEVNYLAKNCYGQTLRKVYLKTQDQLKIPVVITENERMITQSESASIYNELRVLAFDLNPNKFNDKLREALLNIGIGELYSEIDKFYLPKSYKHVEFNIDELEIFLQRFGKYMKLEDH